jgi:hypothetical protein
VKSAYNPFVNNRVVVLLMLSLVVTELAHSQRKPCTKAEQSQAETEADTLRSWDALYKSYRLYGRCDNALAAEGYSESIARILVDHWNTLPKLAELIRKDKGFGEFVGLDTTMNMKDVAAAKQNATRHCPAGLAGLCSKLAKDADAAIAEDAAAAHAPVEYPSPDHRFKAVIVPGNKMTGVSESRVSVLSSDGTQLQAHDFSSSDGEHGYGVNAALWTSDSQNFVFRMSSSGGHSPMFAPIVFWNRKSNRFYSLTNYTADNSFVMTGPDQLKVLTWPGMQAATVSLSRLKPSEMTELR